MVDSTVTLGASREQVIKRVATYNYNTTGSSIKLGSNNSTPTDKDAPVGYTPQTPTGVLDKTTEELKVDNYVEPLQATKLESFGAAFGAVGIDYFKAAKGELIFEYDPSFKHQELSDEFFKGEGVGTKEELRMLAESKSYPHWQYNKERIVDKRMRAQAMSDNPLSSMAGSLIDADLALTVIPIVGAGAKAAKTAGTAQRLATRAAAGGIAAGGTVGVQSLLGDSLGRTDAEKAIDASIVGMARMFAPLAKSPVSPVRPTQAAIDVVEAPLVQVPTVAQQAAETATREAARADAIAKAKTVGRTDAEIAAERVNVRGDLRQARAAERKAAIAQVNKEFDELAEQAAQPTAPIITPRTSAELDAARQVWEDALDAAVEQTANELRAAKNVKEMDAIDLVHKERLAVIDATYAKAKEPIVEYPTPPVPVTPILTSEQRIAQQAMDELAELQRAHPTGSPAQQVAKHHWIAKFQSTADELNYLTQGDTNTVVNKLYSNPAINNGDDVVSAQNVYLNNYEVRLMGIEDSLKDAVAATGVRSNPITRWTGKYREATQQVSADFQVAMQKLDTEVLEYFALHGTIPDRAMYSQMIEALPHHPSMKKLMNDYLDSGFATKVYDDVYDRGWLTREVTDPTTGLKTTVNGMDDVVRRPSYMPLRHSFDKIEHSVNVRKIATMDEMADFIGAQITRMYPDLLNPKNAAKTFVLSERQIGQHFIQTQEAASRGLADVSSTGMNKSQIADILTQVGGMTNKDAGVIASRMFDEMHAKGTNTPKHLRRRIEWDWGAKMRTSSGHELTMRDLVDDSVMGTLEDYGRSMAHRNGMADYGLNSVSELENLLQSYLSKLPEGTNVQNARQFMSNTRDVILGRAIESNPVPEGIRSAQAMADLFLLANSGLYTMIDIATQMQ